MDSAVANPGEDDQVMTDVQDKKGSKKGSKGSKKGSGPSVATRQSARIAE